MLLGATELSKSYGVDTILSNMSFFVEEDSKIGIVGKNGTGKSTLLKIIAGVLAVDGGKLDYSKDITIGYLSQESNINTNQTIYEEVLSVFSDIVAMEKSMRSLEKEIAVSDGTKTESLLKKYSDLTEKFESMSGYEYESRAKGILIGLGFPQTSFEKSTSSLSGGEKTRISLAKIILKNPDLLLLDEPTNFLDIETIQWLETYLKSYKGAYIIISHDRYFLDALVNTIFEIENKTLNRFNGNYSEYVRRKEEQFESEMHQFKVEQKEIRRQEEIIKRFRQFNREKSIKKAKSREKMLDKMPKTDRPFSDNKRVSLKFEPKVQSSKLILEAKSLSKSYDKHLFENVSFDIYRGDKIGLIGVNGSGKSTLLKIINGEVTPDTGNLSWGQKVIPAYFKQDNQGLDPNSTPLDEVWDAKPLAGEGEIRNILSYFRFYGEDVFKEIGVLSGGELSRISLAKTMLSDANFIMMDEPTNHLDMSTVDVLEQALNDYTGTLFIVSHDRYFLNKTVNRLFVLKDEKLEIFNGNYDYYMQKMQEKNLLDALESEGPVLTKTEAVQIKKLKNRQKKEIAQLKKEIAEIETEILTKEAKISELEQIICSTGFYDDFDYSCKINRQYEEMKSALSQLMEIWTDKQTELEDNI
ncbi:ABC-F family ATP-binding cassette domain-containing protein [Alkalibacter sp. M17DMB]|nr:ABC-F family ATP-binding cassette domain-containing protein [Alkalibacter mobilis]